ncbi:MAG TPA: sodium-dependent transporter [Candidatus Dormibacteraeota bacterium]|nr:sodium-dependent transporter [Candidatus Dormibacteraeota bacterium]
MEGNGLSKPKDSFTTKLGFIFASAGSAIGLGALWEFPYMTGSSGGGAFFFMFLIFTFLVGLPILLAEYIIGRGSQKDAVRAYNHYAPKKSWHLVGRWGIVGSIILLSFYSVVGGWIIIYIVKALTGGLGDLSTESYGGMFESTTGNYAIVFFAHIAFLLITVLVVSRGIKHGIEKASKFLMPALLILLIVVVAHSLVLDNAMEGVSYFLSLDFSSLNGSSILMALGQSFFLLSVGFSNQVTYSSYVSKDENLVNSATVVVIMNIVVAFLAGLAIFPAVFSIGIEPEVGPGLLFIALPAAFGQMPFGIFFFAIFLILFLFAALTSAFPLLEVVIAAITKDDQTHRKKWTWIVGTIIFVLGIPSALSFGVLGDFQFFGNNFFDNANFLVSNIMLPLGALMIALFIHFQIPRKELVAEFTNNTSKRMRLFVGWLFIIKYVAPFAIILAFLNVIGFFKLLF